jgi:hypothetical protein
MQIEAATNFGARRPERADDGLSEALALLALEKLREYDLDLGMEILRALTYLGTSRATEVSYALDYLVSQQSPSGRVGYYARELSRARSPAEVSLHLSLTVSFIWTLASAAGHPLGVLLERSPAARGKSRGALCERVGCHPVPGGSLGVIATS